MPTRRPPTARDDLTIPVFFQPRPLPARACRSVAGPCISRGGPPLRKPREHPRHVPRVELLAAVLLRAGDRHEAGARAASGGEFVGDAVIVKGEAPGASTTGELRVAFWLSARPTWLLMGLRSFSYGVCDDSRIARDSPARTSVAAPSGLAAGIPGHAPGFRFGTEACRDRPVLEGSLEKRCETVAPAGSRG